MSQTVSFFKETDKPSINQQWKIKTFPLQILICGGFVMQEHRHKYLICYLKLLCDE